MFRPIGPHQCDAEYNTFRKILSAGRGSNPGPTSEKPALYHYTKYFSVDKSGNNHEYPESSNYRSNEPSIIATGILSVE